MPFTYLRQQKQNAADTSWHGGCDSGDFPRCYFFLLHIPLIISNTTSFCCSKSSVKVNEQNDDDADIGGGSDSTVFRMGKRC